MFGKKGAHAPASIACFVISVAIPVKITGIVVKVTD